jgi:AcrR family transcriptional regulator
VSPQARPSRQEERRERTRKALLDATVDSLSELGFAGTTTLEVQKRAGVSRGALLHHFPSKAELLVGAIHHLIEMRGREIAERAKQLPETGDRPQRIAGAMDLLWGSFRCSLFSVALELRNAARTDPELREALLPAERLIRDRICAQSRKLFGPEISSRPGFEPALDLTLQLMIGTAMTAVLHDEPDAADAMIDRWKSVFPTLLPGETT